jgi:predicted nucleic acid-binding protein
VPVFVDTNLLVYAEDEDAGRKRDIARARVRELWESKAGVISVQVLQEFFVTTTRKVPGRLAPEVAHRIVEEYLAWTVVETSSALVVKAIRRSVVSRVSFWDALIVEAALAAGCDVLLSEDLSDGQVFDGVRVVNPFLE